MNGETAAPPLFGLASGFVMAYVFGFFQVPNAWSWTIGAALAVGVVLPRIEWKPSVPEAEAKA